MADTQTETTAISPVFVVYNRSLIRDYYDGLSRLIEADYDSGATVKTYGYDLAGNMTNMNGATRTYNAANQMTNDGTNTLTYDANGNLTNDGVNSYTWDRANRLLSHGGLSYAYDGLGNRVSQDNGSVVTKYLLDTQPGLAKVLRESDGTNTNHYVHGLHSVHAQYDGSAWEYMMHDGLNSVRGLVDASAVVQQSISYGEYGDPDTSMTGFAFTGEQRDSNGPQYHRARYYDPQLGVWMNRDILETTNRYAYVDGNVSNMRDPSGLNGVFVGATCTQAAQALYLGGYEVDDLVCVGISLIERVFPRETQQLAAEITSRLGTVARMFENIASELFEQEMPIANPNDPFAIFGSLSPSPSRITPPSTPSYGDLAFCLLANSGYCNGGQSLGESLGYGNAAALVIPGLYSSIVDDDSSAIPQTVSAESEAEDEDECPINIRQIFDTPNILAPYTPSQVECAFDERWIKSTHKSPSGSENTKWNFRNSGMVVVRHSMNDGTSQRHFRDANNNTLPYWKLSGAAGTTPPQLWVVSTGVYSSAPSYRDGIFYQGTSHTGPMILDPSIAALVFNAP